MKMILVAASAVLLGACATATPPKELIDARAGYQRTSTGPASTVAVVDVHDAKVALKAAEQSFSEDGDSVKTRDLAYIADRRAIAAEARGDVLVTLAEKQRAEAELARFKDNEAALTKSKLQQTKSALTKAQQDTEREREARAAADAKARDALAAIAGLQSKQSDRGLVLTLSGSVLFATNKSELLPAAKTRLAEVAKALNEDKRAVTVLGHTDAQGSDELNTKLSQDRATSVRTYLVSQGIPAERVKAEGMGKTQPIADNASPEGRANNRRVEIVLENGTAK